LLPRNREQQVPQDLRREIVDSAVVGGHGVSEARAERHDVVDDRKTILILSVQLLGQRLAPRTFELLCP
jgi:hypothetical protein